MNKKTLSIFLVVVVLISGVSYVYLKKQKSVLKNPVSTLPAENTSPKAPEWKTYHNDKLSFSIKYPSEYSLSENSISNPEWKSVQWLSIFNPKDVSTYEFHAISFAIVLQKQPVIFNGKVYHSVEEYIQKGHFVQQEASNPKGDIVVVNGSNAINYHFNQSDARDSYSDMYLFIKDDLMYQIFINAEDPNYKEMLQSISFK